MMNRGNTAFLHRQVAYNVPPEYRDLCGLMGSRHNMRRCPLLGNECGKSSGSRGSSAMFFARGLNHEKNGTRSKNERDRWQVEASMDGSAANGRIRGSMS
jgi:hypothetical protein